MRRLFLVWYFINLLFMNRIMKFVLAVWPVHQNFILRQILGTNQLVFLTTLKNFWFSTTMFLIVNHFCQLFHQKFHKKVSYSIPSLITLNNLIFVKTFEAKNQFRTLLRTWLYYVSILFWWFLWLSWAIVISKKLFQIKNGLSVFKELTKN